MLELYADLLSFIFSPEELRNNLIIVAVSDDYEFVRRILVNIKSNDSVAHEFPVFFVSKCGISRITDFTAQRIFFSPFFKTVTSDNEECITLITARDADTGIIAYQPQSAVGIFL